MNQQIVKFIESRSKGSSEVLSNTMGTAKEIATLFKYSPKCESIFWEVIDNVEIEAMPHKMDSKRFLLRIHSRKLFFSIQSTNSWL